MNQNIFLAVCVCGSMMNCLGRSCLPLGSPGGMFRAFKTSFQQGCHHKVSSQNIFLIFFGRFRGNGTKLLNFDVSNPNVAKFLLKFFSYYPQFVQPPSGSASSPGIMPIPPPHSKFAWLCANYGSCADEQLGYSHFSNQCYEFELFVIQIRHNEHCMYSDLDPT